MKRYRFRLEQVLRVRRLQKDSARNALLLSRRELDRAEQRLWSLVDEYRAGGTGPSAAFSAEFLSRRTLRDLAALKVLDARDRRNGASDRVAEHLGVWTAAARRVKALERLDERARDEYAVEAGRHVERETDDVVVGRHWRQR